jgi:heavy metal sensor kinase
VNRSSIRFRLTIWYSAVLLLGLVLFGIFLWFAMGRELFGEIDVALQGRVHGLEEYLRIEAGEHFPTLAEELHEFARSLPDYEMEVRNESGSVVFGTGDSQAVFSQLPHGRTEGDLKQSMEWRGAHYRILNRQVITDKGPYSISVAAQTDEVRGVLRRLGFLMLLGIPGVACLAAAGGYLLSRRALNPVRAMTDKARQIEVTNLSERLAAPKTGDEIQSLAETWNEMLARLETAVTKISQFTSDASHELRTPVAFIRTTAEVALRRSRSQTRYREALEQIEIESERMTGLLDHLLFLSRTESAPSLPLESLDVRTAVQDAFAEIEPLAASRRIGLELDPYQDPMPVIGNESALRRMLLAILDNAVKYSCVGGSVTVSVACADGHAHISIKDSGSGIPEQALPFIFDRFFRADPSRNRESGGYGLGLSIAQAIAHLHRGSIRAESAPDAGSVFHINLPLAVGNPP